MASDETMIGVEYSSTGTQGEDDDDEYGRDDQSHPLNLSMMCTSNNSMYCHQDDDDGGHDSDGIRMFMSRLSIESFDDGDGDEKGGEEILSYSDSDEEEAAVGCYSLPATPPPPQWRRSIRDGVVGLNNSSSNSEQQLKEYGSEADDERRRGRGLGIGTQRWGERALNCINYYYKNKELDDDDQEEDIDGGGGGEPGRGGGVVLITRAKGGRRTLRMDLEEVKACNDLGFELEHHHTNINMLDFIPIQTQTPTTSGTGLNSSISSCCISTPGDDPQDVKARLKVWAQAVALVSTSGHPSNHF